MIGMQELCKRFNLDDNEKELIDQSINPGNNRERIHAYRSIADFAISKKLKEMNDKLIASNAKLSETNNKYARSLNLLTFALVLVTLLNVYCN